MSHGATYLECVPRSAGTCARRPDSAVTALDKILRVGYSLTYELYAADVALPSLQIRISPSVQSVSARAGCTNPSGARMSRRGACSSPRRVNSVGRSDRRGNRSRPAYVAAAEGHHELVRRAQRAREAAVT